MYKLIIKTTKNYPHYERMTREYLTLEMAEREFERISDKLANLCNTGEIQDYELDIVEK